MLILSEKLISQIREHSENSFPEECIGALLGRTEKGVRTVTELVPLKNTSQNKRLEFAVSDIDLLNAEKKACSSGVDVIGFYHSHANYEAIASEKDKSFAIPGLSYPIVQVLKGKAVAVKSYAFIEGFEKDNFSEEEIVCQ